MLVNAVPSGTANRHISSMTLQRMLALVFATSPSWKA
jgi:hypothetical protein